jgi:hypothetical protein
VGDQADVLDAQVAEGRAALRQLGASESASNVLTALISTAGGRNVTPETKAPRRTRSVRAAW